MTTQTRRTLKHLERIAYEIEYLQSYVHDTLNAKTLAKPLNDLMQSVGRIENSLLDNTL